MAAGYPPGRKALVINCTLKRSPEPSNTEAPAGVVGERLTEEGVDVEVLRAVDMAMEPGVAGEAPAERPVGAPPG
ncbi:hypothetical protein [Streptomyces collinus]|uniref:hypothetical protein n=1 Tax=Streptomyces collinus TaxID=42684 RepID=UPI0033C0F136